jgi:hypothetical protein
MQISQRIHGDSRCSEGHAAADTGVEHPIRQHRYDAGLDLDVHDATTRTSFAVVSSHAAAVKWMPRIVDFNFLPDMGRMTA